MANPYSSNQVAGREELQADLARLNTYLSKARFRREESRDSVWKYHIHQSSDFRISTDSISVSASKSRCHEHTGKTDENTVVECVAAIPASVPSVSVTAWPEKAEIPQTTAILSELTAVGTPGDPSQGNIQEMNVEKKRKHRIGETSTHLEPMLPSLDFNGKILFVRKYQKGSGKADEERCLVGVWKSGDSYIWDIKPDITQEDLSRLPPVCKLEGKAAKNCVQLTQLTENHSYAVFFQNDPPIIVNTKGEVEFKGTKDLYGCLDGNSRVEIILKLNTKGEPTNRHLYYLSKGRLIEWNIFPASHSATKIIASGSTVTDLSVTDFCVLDKDKTVQSGRFDLTVVSLFSDGRIDVHYGIPGELKSRIIGYLESLRKNITALCLELVEPHKDGRKNLCNLTFAAAFLKGKATYLALFTVVSDSTSASEPKLDDTLSDDEDDSLSEKNEEHPNEIWNHELKLKKIHIQQLICSPQMKYTKLLGVNKPISQQLDANLNQNPDSYDVSSEESMLGTLESKNVHRMIALTKGTGYSLLEVSDGAISELDHKRELENNPDNLFAESFPLTNPESYLVLLSNGSSLERSECKSHH